MNCPGLLLLSPPTVHLIAPGGSFGGGQTPRACSAGAAGTLCREVRGGAGRLAAKTACRKLSACAGRLPQTTRKWPPMAGGLKVRHRWLRCVRCCSAAAPAAPCSADARGGVARPDLAGARVAPWRPGRLLVVLWLHLLGVQPLGVTLGVAAARRSPAPHRCALRTAAGCRTARDALPSLCGALARPAPAVAVGLMRADDRLPAVLRPRNRRRFRGLQVGIAGPELGCLEDTRSTAWRRPAVSPHHSFISLSIWRYCQVQSIPARRF